MPNNKVKLPITFFRNEYYFLSNFYMRPIEYRGHTYKSAEHAYQAAKATTEEERKWVADAPTPVKAKSCGRRVKLRHRFDQDKFGIMGEIVYCKFSQHKDLKEKLLATKDVELIEGNWWHDNLWGDCISNWERSGPCKQCQNVKGKNYLGRILMEVREILGRPSLDVF